LPVFESITRNADSARSLSMGRYSEPTDVYRPSGERFSN